MGSTTLVVLERRFATSRNTLSGLGFIFIYIEGIESSPITNIVHFVSCRELHENINCTSIKNKAMAN